MSGVSPPPQLSDNVRKKTLNRGNSPQERAQALARAQKQSQAQQEQAPSAPS